MLKYIINLFPSHRHFILIYALRYQERRVVKLRLRVSLQIFILLKSRARIELPTLDWISTTNWYFPLLVFRYKLIFE